ncbi:MAG TPA: ABC transporter substrate-binding protein, partial [Casimicrobiaceae bacterium]|nr:ABC transporter substrate-binding protein [Casimicrobiaceae bacterium]
EALPAEFQSALDVACREATVDMLAKYDSLNPPALRRLVASGTQLRAFPRDLMEACYKAAHALYDDVSGKNPRFRKVYDAWRAYRDEQLLWFRVAEAQFDTFMQTMNSRSRASAGRRK